MTKLKTKRGRKPKNQDILKVVSKGEVNQKIEEPVMKEELDNKLNEELEKEIEPSVEVNEIKKRRGRRKKSDIGELNEVIESGEKESEEEPKIDPDEQDILDKADKDDEDNPNDGEINPIIREVLEETRGKNFNNIAWWLSIPKRDRFNPGDIVYHVELDRFAVFISPSRKEGLVKTKFLKLGSKVEAYTRDWYLGFEDLTLAKRGATLKRGFAENDNEFLKKAGRVKQA